MTGTPRDAGSIEITPELRVPKSELHYRASRSGGPGGQHVNRAATRIELVWDIAGSPSLSEDVQRRLLERLARRLDSRGRLRLVSDARRSQAQNRDDATERFRRIVATALRVAPPRKPTRPTAASVARRKQEKRRRGRIKQERRPVDPSDE